jgi:hypothetical protein
MFTAAAVVKRIDESNGSGNAGLYENELVVRVGK